MRIAYLVNNYPSVTHSFIRREINALEKLGFEVERFSLRGWDLKLVDEQDRQERQKTKYVLRQNVFALLHASIRILLANPKGMLRSLRLALSASRRADRPFYVHLIYLLEACLLKLWMDKADVEHLHAHFGTNSAEVAMLVHTLGGPAWSFTVHGPEEFDKGLFLGMAEKIRQCAFVVAISSFGRSQLYRLVEHKYWEKIKVVHCGLEFDTRTVPSRIPDVRRLVCVGRLSEQKGQLLLIEAARLLMSQDIKFELVLAGDGELRAEIETLIEQYQMQDRVRVTGWISGEQVNQEILASRALILPSFAEGLPVVLMEAMSLARPVVSTFVAGIPELVQSGKNGWLVPAGDVGALAEAMRLCLAASIDVLDAFGREGLASVMVRHDINTEVQKLSDLFRNAGNRDTAILR